MALLPFSPFQIVSMGTGMMSSRFSSRVSVSGGRPVPQFSSSLKQFAAFQARVSQSSGSSQAKDESAADPSRGESFLKMWERARQVRKSNDDGNDVGRRDRDLQSVLKAQSENGTQEQGKLVVDRAAAALAAVNALLANHPAPVLQQQGSVPGSHDAAESPPSSGEEPVDPKRSPASPSGGQSQKIGRIQNAQGVDKGMASSARSFQSTPGPEFWSWVPPKLESGDVQPRKSTVSDPLSRQPVSDKNATTSTRTQEQIDLPVVFQTRATPSLPPLQSLLEMQKEECIAPNLILEDQSSTRVPEVQDQVSTRVPEDADTAHALKQVVDNQQCSTSGVNEDGSRWWQESGVECRDNEVVCTWTVIRGVSANEGTEWEEKFWEAYGPLEYKELGAEKSGRDSSGRVWHEVWKESMWQDARSGQQNMEKMADKWGQDAVGGQWREKWFEHYDTSGHTEKWADKWSQIDPGTNLEPGHAHTWCERWGENFDGQGGAVKYTDKWAERKECGDTWTKWGDKWDEHFDRHGHGVKQGETWWEGTSGERWNRTWGEGHNGTGWVHKYGKSSCGEHWDTHVQEDTWYERQPHFGFKECFENSRELRSVKERRRQQ